MQPVGKLLCPPLRGFSVCLTPGPFWAFTRSFSHLQGNAAVLPGTGPYAGLRHRALEGAQPGRAPSPLGTMVSDLKSSSSPSAAHGPLCPQQPY